MAPVPFRPCAQYIEAPLAERKLEIAKTDGDLAEELWLSLHHAAEVESVGVELLKLHRVGKPPNDADKLKQEWRELRAYIRQAETFYRGAAPLSWTSSPLNYYYSFLNLAKASCLLAGVFPERVETPETVAEVTPRRIHHGLVETILVAGDRWTLRVASSKHVFALFYELAMDTSIPEGTVFEVRDLLGYSLPIGWQLQESGYDARVRSFLCRWAMLGDSSSSWDLISMPTTVQLESLPNTFFDQYESVITGEIKAFVLRAFDIKAVEASHTHFFQRKGTYPKNPDGSFHSGILLQDFRQALKHSVFPNLSNTSHQFVLALPCATMSGPSSAPMSPEVATYAIWYFLSSLVRYHPEYMDKISSSSDAWLIESFVKSASLDLLRMMTARILGYSLVMLRA